MKNGTPPMPALRAILSTGSPLAVHSFDYVERTVKPGVILSATKRATRDMKPGIQGQRC